MKTLTFDELLRSLKQNIDTSHSFFLGAGASVESGIHSASDCIWDWKMKIFASQNPTISKTFSNSRLESVQDGIQDWIDNENKYPSRDSEEEYSFYAESVYPINDDRRKYFQGLVQGKEPSLGYHLISLLAERGWVKSVWTTNFDGLMVKAANQYSITPIEVTLESQDRIYRNDSNREFISVALHGDYKYGPLKNTELELDSESGALVEALKHEAANRNLVVIGYSGRDSSLMSALSQAYEQPGAGRLYWCGYGSECAPSVKKLLDRIAEAGRQAFYIPTDGFDKTMLSIASHCMSEDSDFLGQIESIKSRLGSKLEYAVVPFNPTEGTLRKIVPTNAYPVSFPKTCYKFSYKLPPGEKPWSYCKKLLVDCIIAVPYQGFIYAWGSKELIQSRCSSVLTSHINVAPFTRNLAQGSSALKDMLIRSFATILANNAGLKNSKDKIWDPSDSLTIYIGQRNITAFYGVQISLRFDKRYTYLTFTPAFHYDMQSDLTKEERKQFADSFSLKVNGSRPNSGVHGYISNWMKKLTHGRRVEVSYPFDSNESTFSFAIGKSSAVVGVNDTNSKNALSISPKFDKSRIVFNGVECRDPKLNFYNPLQNTYNTDFHPMRGLLRNAPYDFPLINKLLKPSINIGILCPQDKSSSFHAFASQLNNKHQTKYNPDYVIAYQGFFEAYNVALNVPTLDSPAWRSLQVPPGKSIRESALALGNRINFELDKLNELQTDVVLIYIPDEYEAFTSYSDETIKFDLHNYVKAYAVQKGIATQFVREKTVKSDLICQIMWALSLAIYVKSGRVPWTISGLQQSTAFAGIGYSVNSVGSESEIVVGCSHVYSSDGQGLKYKLARVDDATFDSKGNPFLTKNEAYKLGMSIKELFYRSFTEQPKRVVVHKRTPFRQDEIDGLVESLSSTGIQDIELLEINHEEGLRCFELSKNLQIDGFPVRRGLSFPLNEKTAFLYTHGIAPSVQHDARKYFQGGKSIPQPLKITKHYGSGSMEQIASEILGLSKMNWNSFGLYSKLPCTIVSSNEIAKIGWMLSGQMGSVYDYRYFM